MTGDTRAYYSARAPEYDRVYTKPERQSDLRAMQQWLPAQLSGRRILEVACGTGYWTQFVAPVARSIVAIDAAPEPLEIARTRVPEYGHTPDGLVPNTVSRPRFGCNHHRCGDAANCPCRIPTPSLFVAPLIPGSTYVPVARVVDRAVLLLRVRIGKIQNALVRREIKM